MADRAEQTVPTVASIRRDLRRYLLATSDCPDAALEALWRNADALLESGESIKQGDRTTIARLEIDGHALILKRSNRKGWFHTLIHAFMRSRARWSWINGRRLQREGIRTAAPVAMLEERFGQIRLRSYLITRAVDGTPLADRIRDPNLTRARASALAEAMHAIWKELERLRLGHGDMKATNFLVDAEDRIHLIDLDGMRRHPRGPTFHRAHERDWRRLMKNFDDPAVNPAARQALHDRFGKS